MAPCLDPQYKFERDKFCFKWLSFQSYATCCHPQSVSTLPLLDESEHLYAECLCLVVQSLALAASGSRRGQFHIHFGCGVSVSTTDVNWPSCKSMRHFFNFRRDDTASETSFLCFLWLALL